MSKLTDAEICIHYEAFLVAPDWHYVRNAPPMTARQPETYGLRGGPDRAFHASRITFAPSRRVSSLSAHQRIMRTRSSQNSARA